MKKLIIAAAFCIAASGATAQDHEHEHGESHEHGEGHKHEEGHEHGEHFELGTTTTANLKYEVFQLGKLGEKEAAFEIVADKNAAKPKALRVWVGIESAEGSVKARAEGGPEYDVHVELPNPMPKNAKLWIEVQPTEGKKQKAAFDLKR